jgi:hypothetical protein
MLTPQNRQRVWHWFKNKPVPASGSLFMLTLCTNRCVIAGYSGWRTDIWILWHNAIDAPGTRQNWRVPNIGHGGKYTYHLDITKRCTCDVRLPWRHHTCSVSLCNHHNTKSRQMQLLPPAVPSQQYPSHHFNLFTSLLSTVPPVYLQEKDERALPCTTRPTRHLQHTQISSNSSTTATDINMLCTTFIIQKNSLHFPQNIHYSTNEILIYSIGTLYQ